MPTDQLNAALVGALAVLLAAMVGLLVALIRRGRGATPAPVANTPEIPAAREIALAMAERASQLESGPAAEPPLAAPYPREDATAAGRYAESPRGLTAPAQDSLPVPEEGVVALLTDPATGLDNRWAWDRLVHEENERRRRYSRPISVVVAELNGIDRLAQRVGRESADRLILAIGEALRRYSRSCDRIARVDYARFYILLPETDEANVVHFVERVRSACDLWLGAGAVALRLSMGWATSGPEEPLETAMVGARERVLAEHRRSPSPAG
ncbi:MAG: GGDEF domain-containing protein [Candidatus Limnocylindrales bacterium]